MSQDEGTWISASSPSAARHLKTYGTGLFSLLSVEFFLPS
jgi:hypothetical protein